MLTEQDEGGSPLNQWKSWDDRLGNETLRTRNWQIAFVLVAVVAIILAIDVSRLSTRVRYLFFAVPVDKLGVALARAPLLDPVNGKPDEIVQQMVRADVEMYIRDVRSVSSDPQAEQQALNRMYAHTEHGSAADHFLDTYLHDPAHNPFIIGQHRTITVEVNSKLPQSLTTWQVRSTETQRDAQGMAVGAPTHWETQLQVKFRTPQEADESDPYLPGFIVTNIVWAQVNVGE
jgi:type IV secretory pathway TrbF-like protein